MGSTGTEVRRCKLPALLASSLTQSLPFPYHPSDPLLTSTVFPHHSVPSYCCYTLTGNLRHIRALSMLDTRFGTARKTSRLPCFLVRQQTLMSVPNKPPLA